MPLATTPTYCATKAALHSYAQSLRYQLSGTSTEVIEVIPPYVQTRLMGAQQQADPRAMPLTDFCDEVLRILTSQPAVTEVCVERVKPLRFAVEGGHYQAVLPPVRLPPPKSADVAGCSPRQPLKLMPCAIWQVVPHRRGNVSGRMARTQVPDRTPGAPSKAVLNDVTGWATKGALV